MMEYVQLAVENIPDELHRSVTLTTAAINAVKAAWDSWMWIVPVATTLLTQISAWSNFVGNLPGVKFIAGNYGKATNAK